MGCFRRKEWAVTNKNDCEMAVDSWVKDEHLGVTKSFALAQNPGHPYMAFEQLPIQKEYRTCRFRVNIEEHVGEVLTSMGEVYAEVMGPDGLAKNCLGQQEDLPSVGGRMYLSRLIITLSGIKVPATS